MNISVFGLGYVGSVTAACLAELGHTVIGVDIQAPKVEAMAAGRAPVHEPGLDALIQTHLVSGRLRVTMDAAEAVRATDASLVCVGTPSNDEGEVDLGAVERCVEAIALSLGDLGTQPRHALILRSTLPPGTAARMLALAARLSGRTLGGALVGGVNPEFMREGAAVADFFDPALLAFGADDPTGFDVMEALYAAHPAERVTMPTRTAELLKYANNAFHTLKIAFANELGHLADVHGADGAEVMALLCRDTRLNISPRYLRPGFAYGGSCLPKDLRTLNHLAAKEDLRLPLLAAIGPSNARHIDRAVARILAANPARVGVLGVAFKAGTDDVRESAVLHLVARLRAEGVAVRMYDPNVDPARVLGVNRRFIEHLVPGWEALMAPSAAAVIGFADLVVLTPNAPPLPADIAVPVLDLRGAMATARDAEPSDADAPFDAGEGKTTP